MTIFAEWMRKPDSHLWDASTPFVLFAVVVFLCLKRVRIPSWRDIALLPLLVALATMYWVHWTLFEYGIVLSDEIAGLIPEGWEFATYVRGDRGMPSRLYRSIAWHLLPHFGLAGIHLMNVFFASLAAILVTAMGQRLAGFWGGCASWLVVLHVPWMLYVWQARPYALFLLASCWALWQLVRQIDDSPSTPSLGGFVLVVFLGALDNPLLAILVVSCFLVTLRRYGWSSIPKRVWLAAGLMGVGLSMPIVASFLTHQSMRHGVQPAAFVVLGVGTILSLPAVFRRDRKGWLAEIAVVAGVVVGFCMWTSWIVPGERVILFVLPWLFVGFLGWAGSIATLGPVVIGITLMVGGHYSTERLSKEMNNRLNWHHDARETHALLVEMQPSKIRFSPNWSRDMFLSNIYDLRRIHHRDYMEHVPNIPSGFSSNKKATCAEDEVVVDWRRKQPTCDCMLVQDTRSWKVYDCAQPPAETSSTQALNPQRTDRKEQSGSKSGMQSPPDPLAGKTNAMLCANNDLLLIKDSFEYWAGGGWKALCCEGPDPVYDMGRCEMGWPTNDLPPCGLWEELRNQIYARYGHPFRSEPQRETFARVDWYERRADFQESWLSDAARANILLLGAHRSHESLTCVEGE